MSDQNIADRLKFLIDDMGVSNSQFADACNISRPTLSQLLTGRNKKVSDILIGQIHEAYPDLSILWLLFGEGEVWLNKSVNINIEEGSNINSNTCKVIDGDVGFTDEVPISSSSGESNLRNACENREMPANNRTELEYSKEKPLNTVHNSTQISGDKDINSIIKNAELLSDLAKIQKEVRKVVQITIYFDDSTFETFYPSK